MFHALSSPIRLFVVSELAAGPRCVRELSKAMEAAGHQVSQPLLSQHLRVLRDLGLVATTRRATEIDYELVDGRAGRVIHEALGLSLGEGS